MAIPYQSNLNVNNNEIENIVIQNLSSAPNKAIKGQMYYNTADNVLYWYTGSEWVDLLTTNKVDRLKYTDKKSLDNLTLRSGIYLLSNTEDITILDETSKIWTVIVGEHSTTTSGIQIWLPNQYGEDVLPKAFIRRAVSSTQWSSFVKLLSSQDITQSDIANIKHNKGYFATLTELKTITNGSDGDFAIVGEKEVIYIWNSTKKDWVSVTPEGVVTSVNGKDGVVNLTKEDIGLGNVNNTSDLDKPVSTPQQEALDKKVSKEGDTMTGPLWINKSSTASEQIRLLSGADNFGVILRNDGLNTYILLTNKDDPSGKWNALRPFKIDNLNGIMTAGNGFVSGSTAASTSTSTGSIICLGGMGVKGNVNTGANVNAGADIKTGSGKIDLKGEAYIQYNSDTETIDFIIS